MGFPVFKRRFMVYDMHNYYAQNTDVWVYGTPQEYRAFKDVLVDGRAPLRILADERGGMDVLVMPPAGVAKRDFLVIHERLVYQAERFNMELIVGGTKRGMAQLAAYFERAVDQLGSDLDGHLHFDADEKILLLPSVYLDIRGPMEDAHARLPELAPPAPEDLPPDMAWRDPESRPYEILDYAELYGRVPLKSVSRR